MIRARIVGPPRVARFYYLSAAIRRGEVVRVIPSMTDTMIRMVWRGRGDDEDGDEDDEDGDEDVDDDE